MYARHKTQPCPQLWHPERPPERQEESAEVPRLGVGMSMASTFTDPTRTSSGRRTNWEKAFTSARESLGCFGWSGDPYFHTSRLKMENKYAYWSHLQKEGERWAKRNLRWQILEAAFAPLPICLQFSQRFCTWPPLHYITRPHPRVNSILMISH